MLRSRFARVIPALVLCISCQTVATDDTTEEIAASSSAKLDLLAGGLGGAGTTDGIGDNARLSLPESVVADGHGNLYAASGRSIRKIAVATAEVTTIAGGAALGHADGAGTAASFDHPVGLALDGAGSLFVSDSGDSSIRKIILATGQVSTLVAGAATAPGMPSANDVSGLAIHGGGLYVADPRASTIRRIDLATIGVVGVVPETVTGTTGLQTPRGVASDGAGNLYVADAGNHTVRRIVLATGAMTTVAGSPGAAGSSDGVGAEARLDTPEGIVADGSDVLYVTTKDGVRKIVLSTGMVTTLSRPSDADVPFRRPRGVATMAGDVFVVDTGNDRIQRIGANGVVKTLAGKAPSAGMVDGMGASARFDEPMGIAIDENDDVFVADRMNLLVRKVSTATGEVTTIAGGAPGSLPQDGVGTAARFFSPLGVATDRHGHLFVADGSNIRRIDLATKMVTTIAYLLRDHDLPVFGIAADGAGHLFVHDRLHVFSLSPSGAPTLVAGSDLGSVDGVGAAAKFLRIDSITTDSAGNLYVVDGGEYRSVRQIGVATGAVTTVKKLPADPWDGNTKPEYRGMAVDRSGAIFVSGSHDVFKLVPETDSVGRFIGAGGTYGVKLGALPAGLSRPRGLVFTSSGSLVIADVAENALLRVR